MQSRQGIKRTLVPNRRRDRGRLFKDCTNRRNKPSLIQMIQGRERMEHNTSPEANTCLGQC